MISTSTPFRRATDALPRFSVASLLLTLVLTATVASMVGIAAWSITAGGPTSADVAAAHKAGYQEGYDAGAAQGKTDGRQQGYDRGHKAGYAKGLRVGRKAGLRKGRKAGYTAGYAAGLAVPRAPVQPTGGGGKKTSH
jgi:hypothetical protein